MTSRRRLRLTADARADLRSILRYTARQWGTRQRDVYRAQLDAGMNDLIDYPERGQERPDIYQGCRAFRVEQHILYNRLTETEILIGRVLHVRQDAIGKVDP
jgi:toxin ParE1/3/4